MRMASPIGFLPVVWMEMAQILSGGKGLYECPSCHVFFTPKRRPRTGQPPYCDPCKQGNKGSSKLYQRRRRAAARIQHWALETHCRAQGMGD